MIKQCRVLDLTTKEGGKYCYFRDGHVFKDKAEAIKALREMQAPVSPEVNDMTDSEILSKLSWSIEYLTERDIIERLLARVMDISDNKRIDNALSIADVQQFLKDMED